ncbi:CBS domain-containing protein [Thiorhodovibrio frisius]|uniref:Putative transcriptional regulator, contains C-terminal CBS domains n=1 Tax=Thiorhodovibrio frisius TaxID=631362 RepID=H8YXG4_9GAMM|nr:CBS domain-containing protein [Thiorhodovibrio frisius]EIC23140.1 putative transcriptional regulator, contains C-terminal CBS domains [Thiorhodovibrio frisius]WPL22596.1 putative voltage-gated ClC-type chloride channel ClcB [Thiorhodovibrio frisius]
MTEEAISDSLSPESQAPEAPIVRVRHVMKRDFDIVDGMDTVAEALARMVHVETKCLIVKKRHADDEFGMVLMSDIARKVLARDRPAERVNIYEIMSKPLLSVPPEMDIRYCARLFARFKLSRAPVVDQREVVGIVSLTDLVVKGMLERTTPTP